MAPLSVVWYVKQKTHTLGPLKMKKPFVHHIALHIIFTTIYFLLLISSKRILIHWEIIFMFMIMVTTSKTSCKLFFLFIYRWWAPWLFILGTKICKRKLITNKLGTICSPPSWSFLGGAIELEQEAREFLLWLDMADAAQEAFLEGGQEAVLGRSSTLLCPTGTNQNQLVPSGSDWISTGSKQFRSESTQNHSESGRNCLEPTGSDRYQVP